jgi:tetratricopeptide (TPR) repeat protein
VNSGEVVGSRETFVTGDAANVAARLEQAAGPGEVLLGEPTCRLVRGTVQVEPRKPLHAKGKSEPVTAYRLLGVASPGAVRRVGGTPFVGREAELMLLEAQFEATVDERHCRLVTIVGEPGVGKSRLAAELIERLDSRARAARGACLSYGEGITYWALSQVVRELAGVGGELSREAVRGLLRSFLGQAPEGVAVLDQILLLLGIGEGATTPEELAWATRRFLALAAAERPLVLVVDDVQWAESALLDLLESLPQFTRDAPLLVVCLARPEVSESRPGWPVTVRLEPLAAAAVDALLEHLGAPPMMRVQIAQTAAGNPLFAEELVAWVSEGGELVEMPTSLNALLGARLDRLDAEARAALERGAVEGELFHQAAIVELSEEASRSSVPAELDTLARKDLIRLAAASLVAGGVAYRFKHILVREAAYLAMTKKLRAVLHERFADWLEAFAGDRVGEYAEIIGYHLEQAHRYRSELSPPDAATRVLGERAARHLGAAGRRATVRGDYHAAANLLERALALGIPDPHERLELQVELGSSLHQTGRLAASTATLAEAVDGATRLGERGVAALALVDRHWVRFADPELDLEQVEAACRQAMETFAELGDDRGLALAGHVLGLALARLGRRTEAVEALERALVHADSSGDLEARRLVVSAFLRVVYRGPTRVGVAVGRFEQLVDQGRSDRVLEAVVKRFLGGLYAMAARFDEALELIQASSLVLDELNQKTFSVVHRHVAAEANELAGDRARAEHEWLARWDYCRHLGEGYHRFAVETAYLLAQFYCDAGRWDDAEHFAGLFRNLPLATRHAVEAATMRLAVEARLAAHEGRAAESMTLAEEAVAAAETLGIPNDAARVWLALSEARRAAGMAAEADAAVAAAIELYELKGNIAAAARARVTLNERATMT